MVARRGGDSVKRARMTRFFRGICALAVAWRLFCEPSAVAGQTINGTNILIVGTQEVPPFAMKRQDGSWEGISIDLWREIAGRLHLQYEFREMPLDQMLDGLSSNRLDAAVAAITITAGRQKRADFTHSYYTSGLAIGVRPATGRDRLVGIFSGIFTRDLLEVVLWVLLAMVASGATVWFFERKANQPHFGGRWWQGMGSGFWWSAATVTTTGYGDKIPRTLAGRMAAVFWMFAGLVIISTFIATVTASLTVRNFSRVIRNFDDLPHHRVAVIGGTTSETYLRRHRIAAIPYPSSEAALQAVIDGKADAFVYDTPLLMYRANQRQGEIVVLPQTIDPQGYGIGFPAGSALCRPVDIALLEVISDPLWQELQDRYLGVQSR
jgi:polar amino acid transport system substrate-binding protein